MSDPHLNQDWHDPDPSIDRTIYIPVTCNTCGVTRDIIDFYDKGVHHVNIVRVGGEVQTLVDHGELAQEQSTKDITTTGI